MSFTGGRSCKGKLLRLDGDVDGGQVDVFEFEEETTALDWVQISLNQDRIITGSR